MEEQGQQFSRVDVQSRCPNRQQIFIKPRVLKRVLFRPAHLMHPESSSSSIGLPPLDYLRPNPVRGQLEPHDEHTRKSGCRFIQCTDTPNELKVRDS